MSQYEPSRWLKCPILGSVSFSAKPWFSTTATLLTAMLALSACSSSDTPTTTEQSQDSEQQAESSEELQSVIPEPEYDGDDTVRLPLAMVASPEQLAGAPLDDSGRISEVPEELAQANPPHDEEIARSETFGCEDTISVIQTVPVVTEDPGYSAVEFLLGDGSRNVAQPVLTSAAAGSGLEVESVETDNGTVTVELSGEPMYGDVCSAAQLIRQVEVTARAATGSSSAEILLDDTPLAELMGVDEDSPLTITEILRD